MCWEGAGEFGVLEAGELLWEEAPTGQKSTQKNQLGHIEVNKRNTVKYKVFFRSKSNKIYYSFWCKLIFWAVTYPGRRAQGWSGSPGLGTVPTDCELGSQEGFHWRTASDLRMTGCGWCAASWTAL